MVLNITINYQESDQEVQDYNYTITVNENNVINNVNQDNLDISVSYDKDIPDNTSLKLVAFDANGKKLSISGLPADVKTSKSATDKKMTVTADSKSADDNKINVLKDENKKTDIYGSYPHIVDGDIYFRLFDAKDTKYETPLGELKVTKNTVEPTVAKVTATRNNTDSATFKATRYGTNDETKATKIYYCAVADTYMAGYKDSTNFVTWDAKEKKFSKNTNQLSNPKFNPDTRTITVSGDEIEETIVGLENNKAYRIYYIVENSYGSQTEIAGGGITLPQVNFGSDVNATKEETVTKISLPTGTDDGNNKFTWDNPHKTTKTDYGYIVTLYKDGKIYYESEINNTEFILMNYDNPLSAIEAGDYYIEVVTKGSIKDEKVTVNSDAFKSDILTVKAVDPVSNIKYSTNESNGLPQLSWDEDDENCKGYTLNLYQENVTTGVFATNTYLPTCYTETNDVKSIYFPTTKGGTTMDWQGLQPQGWHTKNSDWNNMCFDRNSGFYVGITANVKNPVEDTAEENTIYVDSQTEYFYFCAPYRDATITSATDSSMTFKLVTKASGDTQKHNTQFVYGEDEDDLSYAVRVYKKINGDYTDMGTKEVKTSYDKDEKTGKITATYFTVEGLEANTDYQFKLITICKNGEKEFEGWSDTIQNGRTMPRIQNLTKVAKETDCKENTNTFYISGSKLVIDGTTYQNNDFRDSLLRKENNLLLKFLVNLKEGDKVTITSNVIDLVLNNKANGSKDVTLNDNDFLDGKILNITGTDYERKIKYTSSTKYPAEVHLKSGQFDLTEFIKGKEEVVTLGNGVKIKTGTTELGKLIVEAGAEVTVNNVKMKTDLQTAINTKTLESNGVELTVVANGEEINNLTFENLNDSVNQDLKNGTVTIKFVSSNGTTTTQQGSITIKGNGGKVAVTQENVTIGSNIEVTVEKGEVDVTDKKLTGGKTVTLSAKSSDSDTPKITAISEIAAPEVLRGEKVTIKTYESTDDLRTELNNNVSAGHEITETILKEVNEWLSKFGVSTADTTDDKGVKVTVDSTDITKVTIENNSDEAVDITGLK